ncbi:B3 domain-containing protein [Canna indica]|uniref:B3 domain-containing protein n=1 Tax=Canna indica TaxID=4628 RepID=A0AAQ3Q5M6_9LILI|nr:B3 domain-containing protein [Canna indica]
MDEISTSEFISCRRLSGADGNKASKLAQDIPKENPIFVAVMQRSNVSGNACTLCIPARFRTEYLPSKITRIILRTRTSRRQWFVRLSGERRALTGATWKKFVAQHNLKKGDMCVFELTAKGESPRMKMDEQKIHFAKLMTGTDFTRHMSVPKKFMEQFKHKIPKIVELKDPSGTVWSVRIKKKATDHFLLEYGWKYFARAHHLEENDILYFKSNSNFGFDVLIFDASGCEKVSSKIRKAIEGRERRDKSFETISIPEDDESYETDFSSDSDAEVLRTSPVTNFKATKNQQTHSPKKRSSADKPHSEVDNSMLSYINHFSSTKLCLTSAGIKRLEKYVRAVKPGNPFFVALIQMSNVSYRCFLTIPKKFAEEHLPRTSQKMILRVPAHKRKWTVSYLVQKTAVVLKSKWKSFVRDNNLEEGDICLFELEKNKTALTVTVHISKKNK